MDLKQDLITVQPPWLCVRHIQKISSRIKPKMCFPKHVPPLPSEFHKSREELLKSGAVVHEEIYPHKHASPSVPADPSVASSQGWLSSTKVKIKRLAYPAYLSLFLSVDPRGPFAGR